MQSDLSTIVAAARKLAPVVALLVAGVFVLGHLIQAHSDGFFASDFKLAAAQRLIDGQTLYPPIGTGNGDYPYPPIWAMLVTPCFFTPVAAQYAAGLVCALGDCRGALGCWATRSLLLRNRWG